MTNQEKNQDEEVKNPEASNENGASSTDVEESTNVGNKQVSNGEGSEEATGSNEGNEEKMLLQSEVNKIAAKEKNQGRNSVYKELGVDPNDKDTIALIKALTSANKADETTKEDNVADELAEAKQAAFIAEAKAEAMMQGCQKQYVEDVVTLATARLSEDSDLKTAFGELKSKYPVWFEDVEAKGSNVGKKGTGSSMRGAAVSENSKTESFGAKLAAKRKDAVNKKSSYWK